jgi:pimeloyl-[acyl-carrier protein] methyl ester esterase
LEKKVEILAYHGWGINADFWNNLASVIPDSIPLKPANRGYFGKPFYPRFDADTKFRVVFTHSYGLHWSNSAVLSKADLLVIFNGFGDFHPSDEKLKSVSEKGLEAMIKGFDTDPEHVLKSFYRNCFHPSEYNKEIPSGLNKERLLEDLKALRNTRFPLIDLDFGSTMVAIDSAEDKILLEPRGENMLEGHYNKKFVKVFENEGHALPFINPKDCWSYLCSIIPIFERYENNR